MYFSSVDKPPWTLVKPNENYLGLSYRGWFQKWFQWLVGPDPDSHNNGDVVFLRGIDSQLRNGKYFFFLRFGQDRLRISENQALFLPLVTYSADEKNEPNCDTAQKRISLVMKFMQYGDNPPANTQATINGKAIMDVDKTYALKDYQFISSDFDLDVPDPSDETYDMLLGPKMDTPLVNPGISKCVVGGYALLIKDLPEGKYLIHSYANGELGYFTRTCVQIEVQKRPFPIVFQPISKGSGSPFVEEIREVLDGQQKFDGQLTQDIAQEITSFISR